ncbi:MAG TPA: FAD-dependent monooxygenase [Pyrinomonadaceae bacterium]|nr:FAD-dependent monooxygenase [Pyrinomonadaceae bacterium]
MKLNIVGGGPAGLYFAILMKKQESSHAITIFERNGPDDTFGWGVVFSGRTLANLRAADAESHAEITSQFEAWENVDVVQGNSKISIYGNSFSGIARLRLLKILQKRAQELGIEIVFKHEIDDFDHLRKSSDLLIGADGVNSSVRSFYSQFFVPDLDTRQHRYIWYGTHRLFHGLTLTFRQNVDGVFAAHSYKFNHDTSTFIVECDRQTWERAGFHSLNDEQMRSYLHEVFQRDLGDERLLSNNSKWINFVLVKNGKWSFENVALLGDALHTAHFSIGSGTKLAMEDAIEMAQCFQGNRHVDEALSEFERLRRPVIENYQVAAGESMVWFENAARYIDLSPMDLAYSVMTRSGRVTLEDLRTRDPEFVREYERVHQRGVI